MTHSGEGRKRSRRIPHPSTLFLELVDSETPLKQNLAAPYLLQERAFLSMSVKALPSWVSAIFPHLLIPHPHKPVLLFPHPSRVKDLKLKGNIGGSLYLRKWEWNQSQGDTQEGWDLRQCRPAVHAKLLQLCPTTCDPWTVAHQAPLSMEFSRQEYWSELPCPSLGVKPRSPTLQADSLPTEPPGN